MTRPPKTRRALRRFAILAAGLPLAACGADRTVTGSTYPPDYRQRHPIVLAEGARTLDVFVNAASGLDPRQREDVVAFATEYRRYGHGPLMAQMPAGAGAELGAHRTLDAVRAALEIGGRSGRLPRGLDLSRRRSRAPRRPIRLSFQRLKAKVAGKCGLWPHDLGVSDMSADLNNEPYWNLGLRAAERTSPPRSPIRSISSAAAAKAASTRCGARRTSRICARARTRRRSTAATRRARSTPRSAIDGVAGKGWRACLIRPIAATA